MSEEKKLSLATRNIVLFVLGKSSSLLGASIYSFAVGLYVLKLTGSGINFAITLICSMVPRIVFGPIAGVIADRLNRKFLVVGSDIASGFIMLGMFAVSHLFSITLPLIYGASILMSIASTFLSVSFSSALPSLVDNARLQKATSLNQTATSFSSILGPIIGGIVFAILPFPTFMLINGIAFLISAITGIFIIFNLYEQEQESKGKGESFLTSMKDGFQHVKENKLVFSILKISFWVNFLVCALTVSLPYIIIQSLSLSAKQYGIIESALTIGMLAASIILSTRKESKNQWTVLQTGLFIFSSILVLVSFPIMFEIFSKQLVFGYYSLLMFIVGIIIISINIPMQILIQRSTPQQYKGRVFGFVETIASALSPLGMIIFGVLLDYIPTFAVPLIAGIALFFVTYIGTRNKLALNEKKQRTSKLPF